MALTAKQQRFVVEYLVDLNATQAAIRAGFSARRAREYAYQLMQRADVTEAIQKAQTALSVRTKITQEKVLERLWLIATADPNELIEHRRICCRHCFGVGHAYQWKTEAEFEKETALAISKKAQRPTDDGGYGYDATFAPHPKCPHCHGEGFGRTHAHDSRNVSPAASALYAGVKQTRDGGFEIKMHDQLAALEKVGKHLGMFTDKGLSPLDEELKQLEVAKRKAELKLIEKGGGNSNAQLLANLIARLPS